MVLNYWQKANGMYILNKQQINQIAYVILEEYMPSANRIAQPVDIETLAEECLLLTIEEKMFGINDNILGLIALHDVDGITYLDDGLNPTKASLCAGTIIINSWLTAFKRYTCKRFTIAHECSHWILHRTYHSPTNQKYQLRNQRSPYIACRSAAAEQTQRKFITDEDWEEWQANSLAAALLMPYKPFYLFAYDLINKTGRTFLSESIDRDCNEIINKVAKRFEVSGTSVKIRMKQMSLINI